MLTHFFLKHQRAGKFHRRLYSINMPSVEIVPNQLLQWVLRGVAIPFPNPFYLQISFRTDKIPFPLHNSEKKPNVTRSTFFTPHPQNSEQDSTKSAILLVFLFFLQSDGSSSLLFQERCLPLLQRIAPEKREISGFYSCTFFFSGNSQTKENYMQLLSSCLCHWKKIVTR